MQLAEALPGSVSAMMRAAGYDNEKDFFKAVEAGKIMANDVLPKFAKELKIIANKNGALDAATKKTRAEMTRFFNALTFGKDTIFQSGMDEGLSYMFGTLADIIKDFTPSLKAFGAAFNGVVSGMTGVLRVVAAPFKLLQDGLAWLAGGTTGEGGANIWKLIGAGGTLFWVSMWFSRIATWIGITNAGLTTTLGLLTKLLIPALILQDISVGMRGKDSFTDRLLRDYGFDTNFTFATPAASVAKLYRAYNNNSPTINVQVSTKDSEFGKAIEAKVVDHNQRQMAVTNAENGG